MIPLPGIDEGNGKYSTRTTSTIKAKTTVTIKATTKPYLEMREMIFEKDLSI